MDVNLVNIVFLIVSGVVFAYLLMGVRIIPATRHAAILRNGRIRKVCNSGIIWVNPLKDKVVKVYPEYRTTKFRLKDAFIKDIQREPFEITVKYLVIDRGANDFLKERSVKKSIEKVLREEIQDSISKEVFENEDIFVSNLEKLLNKHLLNEGILIHSIELK
ncbi:MAG: SPFH domain-containing protein [Candidatus Asgardarchaeia archaeon]